MTKVQILREGHKNWKKIPPFNVKRQNFVAFSEYLNFKTSNDKHKTTVRDFFEHISHYGRRIDYQDWYSFVFDPPGCHRPADKWLV